MFKYLMEIGTHCFLEQQVEFVCHAAHMNNSQFLGQNLNSVPPRYETGVLAVTFCLTLILFCSFFGIGS